MPSTVVRRIACDEANRTLSVRFVPSGARHDYFDVPKELAWALRAAPVKGRHFNAFIRDRFALARVGAVPQDPILRL